MKKISDKQLEVVKSHVDCMIKLTSEKLDSKLELLLNVANSNLDMVDKGRIDYINGLGIVQSDSQEIDVLSARLNTYMNVKKFIEEDSNSLIEQLECMIGLVSSDLKRSLETIQSTCIENSKSIKQGFLENINGMGVLQDRGLSTDILSAKLYVYLTCLNYAK